MLHFQALDVVCSGARASDLCVQAQTEDLFRAPRVNLFGLETGHASQHQEGPQFSSFSLGKASCLQREV